MRIGDWLPEESERFWRDIEHFTPEEFGDPTGLELDAQLITRLEVLRNMLGWPIKVNAWYSQDGHSEKSQHYVGRAADIVLMGGDGMAHRRMYEFTQILRAGFTGIGFYPYWNTVGWHVDVRPGVEYPTMWYRDRKGSYHYGLGNILDAISEAQVRESGRLGR